MRLTGFLILILAAVAVVGTQVALNYNVKPEDAGRHSLKAYSPEVVTADGVIEGAQPEIAIAPEITGTIAAIPFRENQDVARGSVLVELVNDTQKQQLAVARGEVAVAKAQLERLINGERQEKRKALAAVESAKRAVYLNAKAIWDRSQKLTGPSVSAERRELDYFRMLKAQAELEEASSERALAEAPARADEVAAAEGRVAVAEAQVRLAQAELAKTRLAAPTAGQILSVHAEPGELAMPNKPILLMADLSKRRVRAFIEELDAPRLKVGQPATVTLDGLPGVEFSGTVAVVMPRMGKRALHTGTPREYKDVFIREVLIDLPLNGDLTPNARVKARINTKKTP
jgi:multidrug resistance efflux pump